MFFYYLLMASFLLQLKRSVFANIPWNVLLLQVPDCSHLFTTVARVFVCGFKYLSCQPVLLTFLKGLSTPWSMSSGILSMGRGLRLVALALGSIVSAVVTLDCSL